MYGENKEVPDLAPVRMLNEFVYCPRLCYIMWVQGEFVHNADTVEGKYKHRRVDKEVKSQIKEEEPFSISSVSLSSKKYGLTTIMDIVESNGESVVPVDYKRGKVPNIQNQAYDPERVQICAQGLILRDNGYLCEKGFLYFTGSKKRVEVYFDDELIDLTLNKLSDMKKVAETGDMPPPLTSSPKCPRCSLVGVCLPDEISKLRGEGNKTRMLYPSRDDELPIYVAGYGNSVRKKGERIVIEKKNGKKREVPLREISQLCLYGNVYVTTPLLNELMQRGVPICYFSYGGWFYGVSTGMPHKNVELRKLQYQAHFDIKMSLEFSKAFVTGKVKNSRTLLRRNDGDIPSETLTKLKNLISKVDNVDSKEILLGLEGAAAQTYFSRFNKMLKCDVDFEGRNRRPPSDPVNAVLSFLYGMLSKECFITLMCVGFDPYLGFYHSPRYGRPALALDLMEEFRPIIAESVAITLFNNEELKEEDFVYTSIGVNLQPDAKKKVIAAYERRINSKVTHPIFDYRACYRRILEIQARLLSRRLSGEIEEYPPFCTR